MDIEDTIDIARALRSMPPRRRRAFLIYADHGSLAAIAKEFGVTRQRARQILARACQDIKQHLQSRPPTHLPSATVKLLQHLEDAHGRALLILRTRRDALRAFVAQERERRRAVVCSYSKCTTPKKPIRSGRMHHACKVQQLAELRWMRGMAKKETSHAGTW